MLKQLIFAIATFLLITVTLAGRGGNRPCEVIMWNNAAEIGSFVDNYWREQDGLFINGLAQGWNETEYLNAINQLFNDYFDQNATYAIESGTFPNGTLIPIISRTGVDTISSLFFNVIRNINGGEVRVTGGNGFECEDFNTITVTSDIFAVILPKRGNVTLGVMNFTIGRRKVTVHRSWNGDLTITNIFVDNRGLYPLSTLTSPWAPVSI